MVWARRGNSRLQGRGIGSRVASWEPALPGSALRGSLSHFGRNGDGIIQPTAKAEQLDSRGSCLSKHVVAQSWRHSSGVQFDHSRLADHDHLPNQIMKVAGRGSLSSEDSAMASQDPNGGIDPPIAEGEKGLQSTPEESLEIRWADPASRPYSPSTSSLLRRNEKFVREQLTTWKNVIKKKKASYWVLLFLSCAAMMISFPAAGLVTRLYYVDGGTSKWLISWLAAAGWPITAGFLLLYCFIEGEYPTPLTWQLTFAYAILGLLTAADNLIFAWAYAYLSASTSALLSSTSLIFTAILAYFIVGQKFNSSIVNAIAVMTTAAVILGLDSSGDRPPGVTSQQYAIGFVLTIAGSAMHGLIFALSELLFIAYLGRKSFRLALEAQTATSVFATLFTTSGILIAEDFQKVHDQAQTFKHGPGAYYQVFAWSAITYQLGILGSVGCLYLASALLAGVLNVGRVPVTAIAAVIIFNDPMSGYKILAIVLTVWSFVSYLWGCYKQQKRLEKQLLSLPPSPFLSEPLHRNAPLPA